MHDSQLTLEILSFNAQNKPKDEIDKVLILSEEKQAENKGFNTLLSKKIKDAFHSKKDRIIPYFGETQTFIIVATSTNIEDIRKLGVNLFQAIEKEGELPYLMDGIANLSAIQKNAFFEGLLLGSYKFDSYKKEKNTKHFKVYVSDAEFSETEVKKVSNVAKAVALTRTLVNEPPNKLDSLKFAERIAEAGKVFGFKTETLHKGKIVALKMGGLLGVNQGSEIPPTFNIMTYKPENAVNKKPLVLVGKGVTFDTGGYSLKTGGSMSTMKADMGGGATVTGVIAAVAINKLPYHVIGLVPATDNKISSKALLVDDVITMMDGTTVEVQNTDAEGRLILADALAYAKRFEPELVIDIATLTGAAAAITGAFGIAMAGNHQEKMDALKISGENTYERLVQLPFWKEF